MSKINKITPLTNVKFLNLYELEAENKFGDTHPYYVASRKNENIMMAATKEEMCIRDRHYMRRFRWQNVRKIKGRQL